MKKVILAILVIILLAGCSQQNDQEQVNIDEKPNLNQIVENFVMKLFPETDTNLKVLNFNNKQELIDNLSKVADQALAAKFVEQYYSETNNGLYLIPKENIIFIDPTRPYIFEKINNNQYKIIQENESSLGKYRLDVVLEKKAGWIIKDINLNWEKTEAPIKQENEIVKLSKDLQSSLILINKENPLPDDYVPEDLVEVNIPFSFKGKSEKKTLREEAAAALELLINKAKEENIFIYGVSGYRSFKTQEAIFASNVNMYGSEEEANKVSAYPGQSEHQTGLVMDVSSASVNYGLIERFAETPEGIWLIENAAEFGFIIRYPKGKEDITGYVYEPWHIRYVGIDHAKKIMEQGITLEEYIEQAK